MTALCNWETRRRTPNGDAPNLLDVHGISRLIVAAMKLKIFSVLAVAAIAATGCVKTVTDSNALAITWSKDSVAGRYNRTVDQVYQSAIAVVQKNGVLLTEYIPHDNTNNVRSLQGRVNDRKVWVRVMAVDQRTSQVDVQARSTWGVSDVELTHQLEKEIALELSAH
ncbi:MAG: hypothetical protein RL616_453 [Verrucomicrobiota bacterium]